MNIARIKRVLSVSLLITLPLVAGADIYKYVDKYGRVHLTDDDLDAVAAPALRHRILLGYEGEASGVHPDELVAAVVEASRV